MSNVKSFTREELYLLIWSKPLSHVAKDFGMSDKGLAKICMKYHIPRPPLGYWAKVQNGQNPKQAPLPTADKNIAETIQITIRGSYGSEKLLEPNYRVNRWILNKAHQYQPPTKIKKYHNIINDARKAKLDQKDRYGRLQFNWRVADIVLRVTASSYPRACLFLESLVRLWISVGWSYEVKKNINGRDSGAAIIRNGDSELSVEIKEVVRQVEHTKEPKERDAWWTQKYDYIPTGQLQFSILISGAGFQSTWKDSSKQLIENKYAEIIESMAKAFEYKSRLQKRKQQQKLEFEKRQEERNQAQRLVEVETERRALLLYCADRFERASALKKFIDAIEKQSTKSPELTEWLDWARSVVTEIDPVTNIYQTLKDHQKLAEKVHNDYYLLRNE